MLQEDDLGVGGVESGGIKRLGGSNSVGKKLRRNIITFKKVQEF